MSRYLIFAIVGISLIIQAMSANTVAVAFPDITASFNISIVLAGWVLSIQRIAMVVTTPLGGRACDSLGRKRTFMFFVLLFTIGSFLCAVSPGIYWLLLSRVIQGIGVGGFMSSATGIVAEAFPKSRQRAIGLMASTFYIGSVLGPNVGGWLTQYFGWKSVFWFNIPWGIAALAGGAVLLKRDGKMEKTDFDLKGAGLLAGSLGAIVAGGTSLDGNGTALSWAFAAALIVSGILLMIVFFRHEKRAKNPMIDLVVLRGRPFIAANVFNMTLGFRVGIMAFVPMYAVSVYGLSTLESGLAMTPMTVGMMVMSVAGSFLMVRWGYRRPMVVGTVFLLLSAAFLGLEMHSVSLAGVTLGGISIMLALVAFSGIGHGVMVPAANNACIELMPERIATITGIRQTTRNLGYLLGVAIASIALDAFGTVNQGFRFVFFGTAIVALISLPFIFAMPRSPSDNASQLKAP